MSLALSVREFADSRVKDGLPDGDVYQGDFVRALFDEMSATYSIVNYVSSFGFSSRWRRQGLAQLDLRPGMVVCDLMSGMGELWPAIARRIGPRGRVVAVDFSHEMCRRSQRRLARCGRTPVERIEADALDAKLPEAAFDAVISLYGLKTMTPGQHARLASQVAWCLKPGGRFSLVEISTPPLGSLRAAYLAYLTHVIPHIGRLLLGNPDNYRLLSRYTRSFGDCRGVTSAFRAAGLTADTVSYFFGCATGIVGFKT